MALDNSAQVSLTQRLRRSNMDECLHATEIAMIAFGKGEPMRYCVGGILYGEIWVSGAEGRDKLYLEPPIQRMPIWLISNYQVIN